MLVPVPVDSVHVKLYYPRASHHKGLWITDRADRALDLANAISILILRQVQSEAPSQFWMFKSVKYSAYVA